MLSMSSMLHATIGTSWAPPDQLGAPWLAAPGSVAKPYRIAVVYCHAEAPGRESPDHALPSPVLSAFISEGRLAVKILWAKLPNSRSAGY